MLSGSERASMTVPSSRRSACDRCRGQKLGCSREGNDPSGRCDRCAKADAKCLTTPIYHMRHYTFAGHDTDGRSTKSMSTTTTSGTVAVSPLKRRRHHSDDRDARDQSKGQQCRGKMPLQVEPQVETTSGRTFAEQSQARPSASPADFNPAFATFEWQSLDAFGKPDQGAGARSQSSHVSHPGWNPIMEMEAASAQLSHPHRGSPHRPQTLATPGWDVSGFALSDYLAGDLTHKNGAGDDAHLPGLPWAQTVQEGDILEQSLVDPDLWGLGLPSNTSSTEETHYRRMEDLSQINLELATQLRRLVNSPPDGTLRKLIAVERERPGGAAAATTPLLGDILNFTRSYLDVLAAATDSRALPDQSSGTFLDMLHAAHAPPSVSSHHYGEAASSSSSSSSNSRMSIPSPSSPDLAASTPPSSTGSAPKPLPDPSMISLALICYVHILRLHVAVLAHIRRYLENVADTDHGKIAPISGFCGFDECHLRTSFLPTVRNHGRFV